MDQRWNLAGILFAYANQLAGGGVLFTFSKFCHAQYVSFQSQGALGFSRQTPRNRYHRVLQETQRFRKQSDNPHARGGKRVRHQKSPTVKWALVHTRSGGQTMQLQPTCSEDDRSHRLSGWGLALRCERWIAGTSVEGGPSYLLCSHTGGRY